ncbi:MAG: hypothetical protein JOZ37_00565 [Actinobacteria bacterium]|nr:hypothetical protein [Actinomycetota bacterium]MBV9255506.1 hypothetical protein [Actinomycetota bacterium]MBV9662426.1 hypothetical protein [Actinomycetota bacterium]MBV9934167.1 hypothetical protein [Actinomycetota bacterium]
MARDQETDLDEGYMPALEDPVTSDEEVAPRPGDEGVGRLVAPGDDGDEPTFVDDEAAEVATLFDQDEGAFTAEEAAMHIVEDPDQES